MTILKLEFRSNAFQGNSGECTLFNSIFIDVTDAGGRLWEVRPHFYCIIYCTLYLSTHWLRDNN